MILSSDAVKVRDRLAAVGAFPVDVGALTASFQSGKQLMDALRELSRAGLVRGQGQQVWLIDKVPAAPTFGGTWKPRLFNLWTGAGAVLFFGWFMFAQVLSPENTCSLLPTWAVDWLERCRTTDGTP